MFKDYARITTSMAKNSVIETFQVDTVMAKNMYTIVFLIFVQKMERKLQSKCIKRNEYDLEQQREKKSSKQFEPLFFWDELWVLTLNMMASILTSKYGGSVCSTDSILTDLCRFSAKAFSHSKVRGSTFN